VTSIVHKGSGKEVFYVPHVMPPTLILPRFYFVAGGIEVSFTISHSASQNTFVLNALTTVIPRLGSANHGERFRYDARMEVTAFRF